MSQEVQRLSVGDIVEGQRFMHDTQYNGMVGEILIGLDHIEMRTLSTNAADESAAYTVRWANGQLHAVLPENLILKSNKTTKEWAVSQVRSLFQMPNQDEFSSISMFNL